MSTNMFQLLLLLLISISNAQPAPRVEISPDKFIFDYTLENGFDNGDSLSSANTILFDVELTDPIICADQTQDCTLVLEFTASDDPTIDWHPTMLYGMRQMTQVFGQCGKKTDRFC